MDRDGTLVLPVSDATAFSVGESGGLVVEADRAGGGEAGGAGGISGALIEIHWRHRFQL